LLGDVTERRLMALPAERTDREVRIDAFDGPGVQRPVRFCRDAPEGDALAGQRLLDPASLRLRPCARGVGLGVQLGAHLARQTGVRTEPEPLGRIALIGSAGLLAVAAHEGVLRLRAGSVGSALRVTAEASERIWPSGRAEVDAAQPGHVGVRPA